MKPILITSLLLGLIPSANATETCNFISEYYPDVTIEIENQKDRRSGFGKIKYKNKPMLNFSTGLSNGYGGQYFIVRDLDKDLKGHEQSVAHGKVVSMIGIKLLEEPEVSKNRKV